MHQTVGTTLTSKTRDVVGGEVTHDLGAGLACRIGGTAFGASPHVLGVGFNEGLRMGMSVRCRSGSSHLALNGIRLPRPNCHAIKT
jgi:hypothetical protein